MRRTRVATAVTLVAMLVPLPSVAQQLTADEQKIAAYIDAQQQAALSLLERIVNINSGTMNPAGVRKVYDALAPEFQKLGFTVRYAALPASMRRGGHLVAERRGSQGKKLLLIGHLDTVFEESSPFQRFTRLNDTIVAGPGVEDMKGGDVVILQALQALHSVGALDNTDITVVMTGDEEDAGLPIDSARAVLLDAGRHADVALAFESGTIDDGSPVAVVARRSSSDWVLTVTGRTAHSSGIFRDAVGAGAIFDAARIVNTFYGELRGEEYLTFNVGVMVGGTEVEYDPNQAKGSAFGKTNVIPQKAILHGDLRTITNEQLARTRERMQHVVARSLPGAQARIEFNDGYPAMAPTPGNYRLLALYSGVSEALGLGVIEPHDPAKRGAGDISFVADLVEAGLDGLGPYGTGGHTVEEQMDVRTMPTQTKRAALLVYRLTRPDASF